MIPILYPANDENTTNRGLGSLSDAISCLVTEERNGIYELSLEYPSTGLHFKEIKEGMLIRAKTNDTTNSTQYFRIYEIGKPINNRAKIEAQHISYDLNNYPITPKKYGWVYSSGPEGFWGIFGNGTLPSVYKPRIPLDGAFTFSQNPQTGWDTKEIAFDEVINMRDLLGGAEHGFLSKWKGEYKFDNRNIIFYKERGTDTGVTIKFGKNMTDFSCEVSTDSLFTHVLPYANFSYTPGDVNFDGTVDDADGQLAMQAASQTITLTPAQILAADMDGNGTVSATDGQKILRIAAGDIQPQPVDILVYAPETASTCAYGDWDARGVLTLKQNGQTLESKYGFRRVKALDLTDVFESGAMINPADVKTQCENYLSANTEIWKPKTTVTVKFQPFGTYEGEAIKAKLEKVSLCDTVRVINPYYGIDEKLKVNKTVFDVLAEKYKSMEIGAAKSNFAETIRSEF